MLEISGSSISLWNQLIGDGKNNDGLIAGIPRGIRSDEWSITTPLKFSQYYNKTGKFPYFSDTIRGMKTDTGLIGLPSWNLITLFRPFEWGYLFWGNSKGLSFFWFSRLFALILVSFEFALILTNKKYMLSIFYSVIISFSPAIQWWYSTPIVEILVFGQMALLIINQYLQENNFYKKMILSILLIFCSGSYIAVFYPAWQISFFYVFLILLFWIIKKNSNKLSFQTKIDIPIFLIDLVIVTICSLIIYNQSKDTISIMMNTVYPGNRVSLGGGEIYNLFTYAYNFLFPIFDWNVPTNTCEMSSFISFFPFAILFAFFLLFYYKGNHDFLLISILAVEILLICFISFPFPTTIAKLSLLSNSPSNRVKIAVGFADIILLIRGLSLFSEKKRQEKHFSKIFCRFFSLFFPILLTSIVYIIGAANMGAYLTDYKKVTLILILFIGFFLCFQIRKKNGSLSLVSYMSLLILLSGTTINPIQKGIDVIFKNDLYENINEISNQDTGLWLITSNLWYIGNLPIMAGAPTINSTNIYPSLERWQLLDTELQYKDIYNRYAHISTELTSQNTKFELLHGDQVKIYLNFSDIPKLNVRYILSTTRYEGSLFGITFNEIYSDGKFFIYQVSY